MHEASKARTRRLLDPAFAGTYFVGRGIDVGGGDDGLHKQEWPLMTGCRLWDVVEGDAQYLETVPAECYDFLHASHCLEHMQDPLVALRHWARVVRPGGHLVITVPDEDMYEQGVFPSTWNPDHRYTFTICKPTSWSKRSVNLALVLQHVDVLDIVKIERIHHGYNWAARERVDQTMGEDAAECAIEVILRKRTTDEVLRGGRFGAWRV